MLPHESILDMHENFNILTNHLVTLQKVFTNDEVNLKVIRSLLIALQPKVTVISKKNSLSKMPLAPLFCKLQEHDMELDQL